MSQQAGASGAGPPQAVLNQLGLHPTAILTLRDEPDENRSWLLATAGRRTVLRGYHGYYTKPELIWEHAVLAHLAGLGWTVPAPLRPLVEHDGRFWCLTRYVPGTAIRDEDEAQQRRRGRWMARLHLALRDLYASIGQRPGWRPQHCGLTTVRTGPDWDACLRGLLAADRRLGEWAQSAGLAVRAALARAGAPGLPVLVTHGDFASWNVHWRGTRLAGVIDFGLAHADSRPYELAIARAYRAPQTAAAYRAELARLGWPLTALEEAAMTPVYQAFRLSMAAWPMARGLGSGDYDLAVIERQLSLTGVPAP